MLLETVAAIKGQRGLVVGLDIQDGGANAAIGEPRETRIHEYSAEALTLAFGVDTYRVELTNLILTIGCLDFQPAETDHVLAIPQDQKVASVEPCLCRAVIEVLLCEAALLGVIGERACVEGEPGSAVLARSKR